MNWTKFTSSFISVTKVNKQIHVPWRYFSCISYGNVEAGQSLDLYMPHNLHTCCGFGYIYKVPFIFILYFHVSSFRTCFACSLPCFAIDSAWPKSTFLFAVILGFFFVFVAVQIGEHTRMYKNSCHFLLLFKIDSIGLDFQQYISTARICYWIIVNTASIWNV